MPVIGHTLVGIITAREFEPGGLRNPRVLVPKARALWMPTLVGLAYLPDVVTQVGLWSGYGSAKLAGHSILLGLFAGVLIGRGWARLSGGSPVVLPALAVGSIVLHDLLDLLQDFERAPFWPIVASVVGSGGLAIPHQPSNELLVYALPFGLYAYRRLCRRGPVADAIGKSAPGLLWAGRGFVVLIVMLALLFQRLYEDRRRQINVAQKLLSSGQFSQALQAADAADRRWPLVGSPGGTDVIRGEAFERLGEEARAEGFYLRAYRREPDNFWAVAHLAVYYASRGTLAERRQLSAPYVEDLRGRFLGHRATHAVLDSVERAISRGP